MQFIPSKRISWILLISLFVFDNFFSYYAVTRLHGKEANPVIAPIVEKYPTLYFFCIPATIIIMFVIIKAIELLALKILNKQNIKNKDTVERIILFSIVIYWAIGNSYMNLAFLLGHRLPMRTWVFTSAVGIASALIYAGYSLKSQFVQRTAKNP